MIKRILLLFFLCYSFFLNSQNVFATQKQINLTQFCTKNGLPQNDIHSIVQDKMGFMWFASNDGLIRYDGFDYKCFTVQCGDVSTNLVLSLFDNKKGDLFVGTADKGLFVYKLKENKFSISQIVN